MEEPRSDSVPHNIRQNKSNFGTCRTAVVFWCGAKKENRCTNPMLLTYSILTELVGEKNDADELNWMPSV
jgi:hypothetical protein